VSWRWEYRIGQDDWRLLAHTYHRVYCTPRRPNEPWDLSARNLAANPWTAALDIACQVPNHSEIPCDLYEQLIHTSYMHPVMPIGKGHWWVAFMGDQPSYGPAEDGILSYHRVAWRGTNENDARVYDICWLPNSFANPDEIEQPHPEVRAPWYAYGERFKAVGALDYIGRLHPLNGWFLGANGRLGTTAASPWSSVRPWTRTIANSTRRCSTHWRPTSRATHAGFRRWRT
jgi:hypothetical protein